MVATCDSVALICDCRGDVVVGDPSDGVLGVVDVVVVDEDEVVEEEPAVPPAPPEAPDPPEPSAPAVAGDNTRVKRLSVQAMAAPTTDHLRGTRRRAAGPPACSSATRITLVPRSRV
jgi:hypothetical protein